MTLNIGDKDRDKVLSEISECQGRVIQTLVPTIIAVGLISIADREKFALITLVTGFAIVFGSSLYVASLSYKIFRNANFIRALSDYDTASNKVHWETVLSKFTGQQSPPMIIGYETKTVSVIYLVFSFAYILMFYEIDPVFAIGLGAILALVALRIFFIPTASDTYYKKWKNVLNEYDKPAE